MTSPIEREYRALLESKGLDYLLNPPTPETVRDFIEGLSEADREFLAIDVDELRRTGYHVPYQNPLEKVDGKIRKTLAASGLDLPCPVHVGEYPHREFNAYAKAGETGTLILLNTGLLTLLDRAGIAMGASTRPFTRLDSGEIRIDDATAEGNSDVNPPSPCSRSRSSSTCRHTRFRCRHGYGCRSVLSSPSAT